VVEVGKVPNADYERGREQQSVIKSCAVLAHTQEEELEPLGSAAEHEEVAKTPPERGR
jgi:hypothetical protein